MSNLDMLPELRKCSNNRLIQKQKGGFISIEENAIDKTRFTVADPVHHNSSVSEILHFIMDTSHTFIMESQVLAILNHSKQPF